MTHRYLTTRDGSLHKLIFFNDSVMEIGRLNVQDHVLLNVCVCFGLLLSFLACLSLHLQQSNHSIRDLGGSHGSSD